MDNRRASPSVDDMVLFAAVAESGGFSAAGRRLGVGKTVVSAGVARLEQRLGVRLFHRTTRRLSLTEAGAAALPHAAAAWAALREAEEAATALGAAPRGKLRVNAPMSFGILHIAPRIHAFCAAYPEISVDLVLDDRIVDLVDGSFDVAIRIGELADSSLSAVRISRSESVLVASPGYLEAAPALATPADLAQHACVRYSLASAGNLWEFHRGAERVSVAVSGPIAVNSSLAILAIVHRGGGIARLPLFAAAGALREGGVVRVLPEWELPGFGVFALTTARAHQPRKTAAFIAFLRSALETQPGWEAGLQAPS